MNRAKKEQIALAKMEKLKRVAYKDLYTFTKHVMGFDLLEPQPHKEVCDFFIKDPDILQWLAMSRAERAVRAQTQGNIKKLIMLPRGTFKCQPKFSKILLADGNIKNIEDIQIGDNILALDEVTLKCKPSRVTYHQYMGKKPVYKVKTTYGKYENTSTLEHQYYTNEGFKELKDIKVGDWITVLPNKLKEEKHPYPVTDEEIKFIAYMIFEGGVSSANCSFTNFDKELQEDFRECCIKLGFNISKSKDGQYRLSKDSVYPRDYLRKMDCCGDKAINKKLPQWVFELNRRQKWLFISIMFATDGYFSVDRHDRGNNRKPSCHVGINLGSKQLIEDIRLLFLSLGVRGTVYEYKVNNKFDAYAFNINAADEIQKLLEMNYPFNVKKNALLDCIETSFIKHQSASDVVPIDYKKLLNNKIYHLRQKGIRVDNTYKISREKLRRLAEMDENTELLKYADSDLYWVQVASVEYVGEEDTYDFETEAHNYVSNGIVVHNSTISTVSLPVWLHWHDPNLRIMIDNENYKNSKKFLSEIKAILDGNELLQKIVVDEKGEFLLEPNYKIPGGFTEDSIIYKNRTIPAKEPSLFCSGVDTAATGMHPDIIIMDDLVSERNVTTEDQIEKVKQHYRFAYSLLEPGGLLIVIGTRYHMNDLYNEIIADDSFDSIVRPAVLPDGSFFFPSRLGQKRLDELKKSQGVYIFNSQYMLNPISSENAVFRPEWFRYYTDKELPKNVNTFITVDLAISQKETADYTVICVSSVDSDSNIYVREYRRGRFTPPETINHIFELSAKYKPMKVGVETVAYQKAMIYFIREQMRARGNFIPLTELKADKDKKRRAMALAPYVENGAFFIKEDMKDLYQEMVEFPLGKHDDTVDAVSYIPQIMRKPGKSKAKGHDSAYEPANKVTGY